MEHERLTKRNLWSYTITGVGRDTAAQLWSGNLLNFIMFTRSLTAQQFGVINALMVAARVFDGFTDPIMGNIIEITRTRWGKFKPWIAIGMVLTAAVVIVTFRTTLQDWQFVTFIGIMLFVYSKVFTFNDVGYWGMLPSLASEKSDRDKLSARAMLFAGIGGGIATILIPMLTAGDLALGGNALQAYARLAIVFSVAAIAFQLTTLIGVKEKPLPPKGEATVNRIGLRTIFHTIRRNDQLCWLMILFLLATTGGNIVASMLGTNFIFFRFGYQGILSTIFMTLGAVGAGVVMLFYDRVSARFTRAQLMKIATASILIGNAFMLFTGVLPIGVWQLQFALMTFGNLFAFGAFSVYGLVVMVCIANTVEYNEWRTGARAEGIIFSIRPFIIKLGHGFVQLIVWLVFAASGVLQHTNAIAGYEQQTSMGYITTDVRMQNITQVINQVPTGRTLALLAAMTIIPSVLAIASYWLFKRKFTLTEAKYEQILSDLAQRNSQTIG
ncbi:MAG: MFS transporter [Oscillospiraceae bacterium]|nr:MFS transporter [Oscillospiraceae bacterium]